MHNLEAGSPVSGVENMRERKLSSLALRLQGLFPDQAEKIESISDSLIQDGHEEILEANRDLGSVGLKPLNEEELQMVELFYQLKAEKQLRDSFSFGVKKTVYQFFEEKEGSEDDELKFAILASFSPGELGEEQQQKLEAYLDKRKDLNQDPKLLRPISENFLIEIIKANPALLEQFESSFEEDVNKRIGYTARQIRETVAMLSALLGDVKGGERILDLCTGTGVISTIVKNLGHNVSGIDLNKQSLGVGRIYDMIIQRKKEKKTERHLSQADVLESRLPDSEVWVAKHPCAPEMALPDRIVQRFAQDSTAKRLYLLTCCADKSVHCCPVEYVRLGVTTEKQWDSSCSSAVDLGLDVDSEEIKRAQEAFRSINETRMKYIKDVLGFNARLIEIPGTIMNQMLVVTKT